MKTVGVLDRDAEQVDVIRAWKDEEYYALLTEAQQAVLPANPAGDLNLDIELRHLVRLPVACLTDPYPTTCVFHDNTAVCTV